MDTDKKYAAKLNVALIASEALWLFALACAVTAWLGCWPWR